jgi:phospholipase/carboxylesterase
MADVVLPHLVRAASEGEEPHPGLVLLHGLGSTEHDLFAFAPSLDPRLVVVSVRAPNAYRWGGFAWYDVEREGPGLGGAGIEDALERLFQSLREIVTLYAIDPGRLYLGGFSMGAAMTGAAVMLQPERFAGAFMLSGYLPPDVSPPRYRSWDVAGKPVFLGHGTQDPTVPVAAGRITRDLLTGAGVDLVYREYATGHSVTPNELDDLTNWVKALIDGTRITP